MSVAMALAVAAALAGCGGTTYFAGRKLPPSGLTNRVLVAVQNPSILTKGSLQFMDAYYDIRGGYTGSPSTFSISGYTGALPSTIQSMPEEQAGVIYGSGDGSYTIISYAQEKVGGTVSGLNGFSSSIFITRNQFYIFAASQASNVLTVVNQSAGGSFPLSLSGVYRVSVNPGGSVALAFVQNSNYVYYPLQLTSGQTIAYSGGPATWPRAAVDCEPQNAPQWCLFRAESPDTPDPSNAKNPGLPPLYYGAPLVFDRPVKAVFSADGGTAYILSCGPECGGSNASVTPLPIAPLIFLVGQQSGTLPTTSALASSIIPVPGGASNALVDSSTLYVVGRQPVQVSGQTLFAGNMTVLDFSQSPVAVSSPISISDGAPNGPSRMLLADDNTLWIGMTKCTNGVRANEPLLYPSGYGCLTMVNVSNPTSPTVTLLEPYLGDLTGIAAVTGLHKIYVAQGGQVYIFSTVDGSSIDNQYVTVTGVAADVAYMDGLSDSDNTVY
jgi:hypothetical protein